jgi:hypothetical protein
MAIGDTQRIRILADPDAWYGGLAAQMGAENYADYQNG